MAQVQVVDLLSEIAQICREAPTPVLISAYVRAARRFCGRSRWLRATIPGSTTAPVTTNYTTGTVTVTNGSASVVGVGTSWLTEVAAGDTFTGPNGIEYTVLSVTSNTVLTLTAVYAGGTLAGQAYTIGRNRGYQLYALGSDTYNEIIGIKAIQITHANGTKDGLTEADSSAWDADDDRAEPDFYQYVPEGQFAVSPVPDAAYPLSVSVVLQPKRGSNSIDDTLVVNWEYTIQRGCLAYLLALGGVKWSDPARAAREEAQFLVDCASAMINADRGYNPGAEQTEYSGPRSGAVRSRMLPI